MTIGTSRRLLGRVDDAARAAGEAGGDYHLYHRWRFARTLAEVERLAARQPRRVLDVGCSPPILPAALRAMGFRVTGVSPHPMEGPGSDFEIAVLDIERDPLPWPDGHFDGVLFTEVIEHLPLSPVGILREMLRVTAPGGWMVVTTPNLASLRQRLLLLRGRSVMYPLDVYFDNDGRGDDLHWRHNREYTASELRQLLGRTGWQVEQLDDFTAYPKMFSARADIISGSRLRRSAAAAFVGAHRLVPGARDSLLAIARRPPG